MQVVGAMPLKVPAHVSGTRGSKVSLRNEHLRQCAHGAHSRATRTAGKTRVSERQGTHNALLNP
eukprot:178030-Chlamydomonas_euryale.AAC.4